ncbi:MAG TPA: WXG100 family type VII secretion target [Chloroflexota bacterium]|nr:WXG100 family type VII secretion target [Chloroflexota bacterium]
MQNEIKMEYPLMEEMKQTFQAGREQLQDASNTLKGIADKLEQGALLGQAGSALSEAVRGPLMGSVQKLSDKFEELQGDIQYAVDQMKQAEATAKSKF